jgi:regulator of protease activity HflC (stomatin/prohibitin superfamily)
LKQIGPPKDVQDTMNKIVKAENEKIAAIDFATAAETTADGLKLAAIKQTEGVRQARILQAQGEAEAIQLVNEAADKYFVGNSQLLKRLETAQWKSRQRHAPIKEDAFMKASVYHGPGKRAREEKPKPAKPEATECNR